jgi:hypothetical protein
VAKIPDFILKALYVRGSLRRTDQGIEFQLKDELGPARIAGAVPLRVDRQPVPVADCGFVRGDREETFEAVTAENSVLMRKGEAVTVRVRGLSLRPGRHTLDIGVLVKDMGEIRFTVGDILR